MAKPPQRAGASAEYLTALVAQGWRERKERGAEERLILHDRRSALFRRNELRENPHLEIHTRGG